MKKCNQCGHLYDDKFEQCPICSNQIAKEICKIVMPVAAISVLIIATLAAIFCSIKEPQILSSKNMKDQYPYIVDEMRLECASDYPDAVFVVDKNKNKYALNGNAFIYLSKIKKDKNFIGYSSEILKDNKTDAVILERGLKLCRE